MIMADVLLSEEVLEISKCRLSLEHIHIPK